MDELDAIIAEVNIAIAQLAAQLGPEGQDAVAQWPVGRSADGRRLLMPRLALLATLCEHPDAATPSRARVDDWETRFARADDYVTSDAATMATSRRIVAITFDALRARLR